MESIDRQRSLWREISVQSQKVHAGDDRIGPENSIALYLALKRAGVPAELHVYESGGHGFGLRPSEHPCTSWPARCGEWLKQRGLLAREAD